MPALSNEGFFSAFLNSAPAELARDKKRFQANNIEPLAAFGAFTGWVRTHYPGTIYRSQQARNES